MKFKYLVSLVLMMTIFLCACNVVPNTNQESTPESSDVDAIATETETEIESDKFPESTKEETQSEKESENETSAPDNENGTEEYKVLNYDGMKAMWLSQFDLNKIYTQDGVQRNKDNFEKRMNKVLDNVQSLGINTIIVQVRPNADSMYPSDFYPMSAYVVGEYGKEALYDPFQIIIDKAHERNFSVHAWINPLRCMSVNGIKKVSNDFKIKQWYDDEKLNGKYTVTVKSNVYLNPAYEEVRNLISNGAAEIVKRYNVDGVHMDDYFYPTTDASFDAKAYSDYKNNGGKLSLASFRRDRVNILVKQIYSAIKAENKDVLFGISPAGNMRNNYDSLYADVATWCASDGYIDYICPQVYFGFDHSTVPYIGTCKQFADMIKTDNIRLIIGISLGKAVEPGIDKWAGKGKTEWIDNKDILKRQLEYALDMPECSGICYFCYQYFFVPTTGLKDTRGSEEKANLIPLLQKCQWTAK